MEGWITLNRSLLDNFIWHDEPFTKGQAWVDLLLLANHAPRKAMIDGTVIDLEPGSYVTSIRRLADRWERSTKWTMKFLSLLEQESMITIRVVGNGNAKRTILFLVNYGIYQASYIEQETQRKRSGTRKGNAKETQDGGKGELDNPYIYNNKQQGNNETNNAPTGGSHSDYYLAEFDEIWKRYPKKHGKQNALKDYIKARKNGVDRQTIENGLTAYISYCQRTNRYFKDGSTWFHQQAWDDDYEDDLPDTDKSAFSITEHVKKMQEEGLL